MSGDTRPEIEGLLSVGRQFDVDDQTYTVVEFLNAGASGEVYLIESDCGKWVLKLYVPAYDLLRSRDMLSEAQWHQISTCIARQSKEHNLLVGMSHPHIVGARAAGSICLTEAEQLTLKMPVAMGYLPILITEHIKGVSLEEALSSKLLSHADVSRILGEVAGALDYIHKDPQYLHADVKAKNILIRKSDTGSVLIDFSAGKNFNFDEVSRDGQTTLPISSTLAMAPPLVEIVRRGSGTLTRDAVYKECFPVLDYYQFGLMLQHAREMVACIASDTREMDYYDHLWRQLTDWKTAQRWATQPLEPKVRRLDSRHFIPFGVPELAQPSAAMRIISLPGGEAVPLAGIAEDIVGNRSFRRLATMNQLSLLDYVYPAANHKRFVHALDTFQIARRLVMDLSGTVIFREVFDELAIRQLLVVALLHDINHFPLLHTVQEAASLGFDNSSVLDNFCSGTATGESKHGEPSIYELLERVGISRERFHRLAYGKHDDQTTSVDEAINSILSSGADIDKMSFLGLDSLFTGVRFGAGLDIVTMLRSASLNETRQGRLHLAFDERALQAVESLFMTRSWNFQSIYWHHTNRAIMTMVLQVMRKLSQKNKFDVHEYLIATQWAGDVGAVRWLDQKYEQTYGEPSITADLIESRSAIYRRLYTVRPEGERSSDGRLFQALKELVGVDAGLQGKETELRSEIAARLAQVYDVECTVEDVLLDLPRRQGLWDPGDAFIVAAGEMVPVQEISEPIRMLRTHYEQLTQRARFFTSPRLAAKVTKELRVLDRVLIGNVVRESVKKVAGVRGGVS